MIEVAPVNATLADGNQKARPCLVCPGVSMQTISRSPNCQVLPSARPRSMQGMRSSSAFGAITKAPVFCFNSSFPILCRKHHIYAGHNTGFSVLQI